MKRPDIPGQYSPALARILSALAGRHRWNPHPVRRRDEQWDHDIAARMFEAAKRNALR